MRQRLGIGQAARLQRRERLSQRVDRLVGRLRVHDARINGICACDVQRSVALVAAECEPRLLLLRLRQSGLRKLLLDARLLGGFSHASRDPLLSQQQRIHLRRLFHGLSLRLQQQRVHLLRLLELLVSRREIQHLAQRHLTRRLDLRGDGCHAQVGHVRPSDSPRQGAHQASRSRRRGTPRAPPAPSGPRAGRRPRCNRTRTRPARRAACRFARCWS